MIPFDVARLSGPTRHHAGRSAFGKFHQFGLIGAVSALRAPHNAFLSRVTQGLVL